MISILWSLNKALHRGSAWELLHNFTCIYLFSIFLFIYSVHACSKHTGKVFGGQNTACGNQLSPAMWAPGIKVRASLGGKHLYPLGHLTGSQIFFLLTNTMSHMDEGSRISTKQENTIFAFMDVCDVIEQLRNYKYMHHIKTCNEIWNYICIGL